MRAGAYMAAYFLAHAVYQSYMSLFYQSRGLDAAGIGAAYALMAAASIPGQLCFGGLSDRARRPGRVLRMLLMASCALLLGMLFARDALSLLALSALLGFFYTAVQPLGDAMALERLRREGRPFGPARLAGTLAFAAASAAFGLLLDASGRENLVALAAAGLLLLALLASLLLDVEPEARKRPAARPLRLLRDGRLVKLLAFALPAQATMGYFYAFFPARFLLAPDATQALLGWANLVAAVAEIPFLLVGDRLYRRVGAAGLVAAATLALCARWLLVGLARSARLLVASQLLHGMGYICISVGLALHVRDAVAPELRASGQALVSVCCYGLARLPGNALGAVAARALGEAGGFLACAAVCALSLAAAFPLWRRALCNSGRDML